MEPKTSLCVGKSRFVREMKIKEGFKYTRTREPENENAILCSLFGTQRKMLIAEWRAREKERTDPRLKMPLRVCFGLSGALGSCRVFSYFFISRIFARKHRTERVYLSCVCSCFCLRYNSGLDGSPSLALPLYFIFNLCRVDIVVKVFEMNKLFLLFSFFLVFSLFICCLKVGSDILCAREC